MAVFSPHGCKVATPLTRELIVASVTVARQLFDGEATITDPEVDLGLQTHGIVEAVFLLLGSQAVLTYSHPPYIIILIN